MTIKNIAAFFKFSNWIKNLLILTPGFFAMELLDEGVLAKTFLSILGFSLTASSIYIFNDLIDLKSDRLHPTKKLRPLAAGFISLKAAYLYLTLVLVAGLTIGFYLDIKVACLYVAYLIINVLYSLVLKSVPVIDLLSIGSGFVIRLLVGCVIAQVYPTEWIIILTVFMALFIPLVKRKSDSYLAKQDGIDLRISVSFYSSLPYKYVLPVYAIIIAITYLLFTFSEAARSFSDSNYLWTTAIPVAMALFRFTAIALKNKVMKDPMKMILSDWGIMSTLVGWIVLLILLYYVW